MLVIIEEKLTLPCEIFYYDLADYILRLVNAACDCQCRSVDIV